MKSNHYLKKKVYFHKREEIKVFQKEKDKMVYKCNQMMYDKLTNKK